MISSTNSKNCDYLQHLKYENIRKFWNQNQPYANEFYSKNEILVKKQYKRWDAKFVNMANHNLGSNKVLGWGKFSFQSNFNLKAGAPTPRKHLYSIYIFFNLIFLKGLNW